MFRCCLEHMSCHCAGSREHYVVESLAQQLSGLFDSALDHRQKILKIKLFDKKIYYKIGCEYNLVKYF